MHSSYLSYGPHKGGVGLKTFMLLIAVKKKWHIQTQWAAEDSRELIKGIGTLITV